MDKINRNNYEAFFLDFAEGNLSENQLVELNIFLAENPDLRAELEAFEIVELPNIQSQTPTWDSLKKPGIEDLKKDSKLRDAFFLRAIENQLTHSETEMLHALIQDENLKKEYALWQKVTLLSGNEKMDKDGLYQLGLDQRLSETNYEYFLIALGEGLLNKNQILELEKFAASRPNGERELEITRNLKLSPAKGIFYPDKARLYKRESRGILLWMYRAGAVAAVFLLGVFIWNSSQNTLPGDPPIAQDKKPTTTIPENIDSTSTNEHRTPDSLHKVHQPDEPALEEWEIREPDEMNYAEAQEPAKNSNNTELPVVNEVEKNEPILIPETIEPELQENLAAIPEIEPITNEEPTFAEAPELNEQSNQDVASTTKTFHSVPEFAEDLMAQKLNIPDSEKDEMAIILAKRVTSKASELLNAEYTKETTGDSGDESLTYTLRIGNFKVQRTKSQ